MKMRFEHVILLDELGLDPHKYNVLKTGYDYVKFEDKRTKKQFDVRYQKGVDKMETNYYERFCEYYNEEVEEVEEVEE